MIPKDAEMNTDVVVAISPLTNEPVAIRKCATEEDNQRASRLARDSFLSFSKTSLAERQQIIKNSLRILEARKDVLAQELTEQMGRPISYTAKEISTAVNRAEYLLKISEDVLQDTPGEAEKGFKRYIKKLPVGPVLIFFTWNYPYLILINSLVPALLAGNSIILSPSMRIPTIAERISSIFNESGLPNNVIQYLNYKTLDGATSLIRDMRISHICFTGSVASGITIQKLAAERIVSVGLELGGKDPAYVRSDVDIAWVAEEIVDGAIFNSGQSCCSIERVYVNEKIHDKFIEAIQKVLSNYVMGDPFKKETNIGPVVSKQSKELIESHINDALQKGAKDSTPENETFRTFPPLGNFVKPTLLTNVTHDMIIMKEETFGPVIPVMKVNDDAEAVQLMNDSDFGLTASIWTADTKKGAELAQKVDAGTVFVNRCDFPSPVSHLFINCPLRLVFNSFRILLGLAGRIQEKG
ncbi:Succinate semialdehyde dehydrogenase [NAD(P)+] Sad [Erysiphe necator]|nr:Succinate semialdehyde dehydrogenase [NAD(P)+] Sad [Erysiphe necator]